MSKVDEYNKQKYKSVTFRLSREKDADVIQFLDNHDGSVNALIVEALRQILPEPNEYELIELYQGDHISLGKYDTKTQAVNALIIRAAAFAGQYIIVKKIKKVSSGVTAGIKVNTLKEEK